MAGLTSEGFTPATLTEIQDRIKANIDAVNPGFDFSPESPDGQLVEIMSYELSQVWNELALVYKSYDPSQTTGAALRNIGLITGIAYGSATRSQATVQLTGTADTTVPAGSIVADADGNQFTTSFTALIPASVQVVSPISGVIPVPAGTITVIVSPIPGWTAVAQASDGQGGATAQTEPAFRTVRNRTVLRNYTSSTDTMQARLVALGIDPVSVVENDNPTGTLPDGTPANQIHVTIGPVALITDEEIALVILNTKPAGISTFGTTAVAVDDSQGNSHTINFTKAVAVPIFMNIEVTWLSDEFAGAQDSIIADLLTHVNNLQVDEDVIQSRLYGIITPYGEAQVNVLEIGLSAGTVAAANVVIDTEQFATLDSANIVFTVV